MGHLQLHTENLKISATSPLAFTTWVVKDLLFLEHSAGPHKTYRENVERSGIHPFLHLSEGSWGPAPTHPQTLGCSNAAASASAWELLHDQCVHKPQFAMNVLYHLSLTIKIIALFFTALSINAAPRIYVPKIAKSQIISTSSGSSHQPMTISSTILFMRNLKTIF